MKVYLLNKVENIVAKEEIAHDDQFLLLPKCFLKLTAAEVSEIVCKRVRVKCRSIGCYYDLNLTKMKDNIIDLVN